MRGIPIKRTVAVDGTALAHVLCELGRVSRLSDLGTEGPLMASAGAHSLFHCLFGRDAIRMAMDLLPDFPADCSLFFDTVHLNRKGGEQFTEYLHTRVI